VTVHDLGYLHYPQAHTRWGRRYLQWSTAHNARTASQIIADSEATKRDLVEYCRTPPERITVVYPGHDPTFAPVRDPVQLNNVRERYGVPGRYALYVGTLQPRKNLGRLLAACAYLARECQDVHLVIAGKKGWLQESLLAQVRELGLQEHVHLTGYVPQRDLPALISGASVFVLPSLYEGFGLPVVEAMACGTPVICSRVSSLPEVVGDAALLIDPHDTADIARSIQRVLRDDRLQQDLTRKGLERASLFSWDRAAQQVLDILLSV
jgi:glycosyltransferase involved in cell wall biosynthesis